MINLRIILRVITSFFYIFFLCSFQWPVTNIAIHSTFGEFRPDHFHNGIDISSHDRKVYVANKGSLAFAWDKSLFPLDHYPGVGNYCIIEHDNELKTIYVHLDDTITLKSDYIENDTIGYMGNTGRSYGTHLHFTVLKKGVTSLNPLQFLPKIINDVKPPVIEGVYIKVGERYTKLRDSAIIRLTRHHPLAVQCYDAVARNERCGVYLLQVWLNDIEVAHYTFDTIILDDKNKLTINSKDFESIYDINGYYIVNDTKYKPGQNTLHIIVSDFFGNKASLTVRFEVIWDSK